MVQIIAASELRRIVLSEKKDAIVLFTGSWCVDCTAFKPAWEQWAGSRAGPVYVLEIKRGDSAWEDWNLREIPTVSAFKNGMELAKASDHIVLDDLERLWGMIEHR